MSKSQEVARLTHIDLRSLAVEIQAAREAVNAARTLVANDKCVRARSFLDRVVDAISTTQAERILDDAETRLADLVRSGQATARHWVSEEATRRRQSDPEAAGRHVTQKARLHEARARAAKFDVWRELAQAARESLEAAEAACESASSTELMDLMTTSKFVSSVSCLQTACASDAVEKASAAVKALTAALGRRAEPGELVTPDDSLDFVVDLAFDPMFDVLSWFNMHRLDDAAERCRNASGKLQPLLDQLTRRSSELRAKAEAERRSLELIEAPWLAAAEAEVPDELRDPLPS